MSDALPVMSGSVLAQETGALAKAQGKTASAGDNGQFPALFQSVMQEEMAESGAEDIQLTPPIAAIDLFYLTPDSRNLPAAFDLSATTAGTVDPTDLPQFAAAAGNGLPQIAWTGYVAVADGDNASAIAMQGDQDTAISSLPTTARDMPNALFKAQQQVLNAQLQQAALPAAEGTDFTAMLHSDELPALQLERKIMLDNVPLPTSNTTLTSNTPNMLALDVNGLAASPVRSGDAAALQVSLPVQHPQWAQQVGERVHWVIGQNLQQAEIRLNPPELGALEVRIQVNGDQANLNFSSPHAVVRDALDAAMPRLREMLQETGLTLGDVNVSGQALAQQQSRDSGGEAAGNGRFTTAGNNDNDMETRLKTNAIQHVNANGLLDVYA